MKEFIMGAAAPAAVFDPMLTLELLMWTWLAVGMIFATIALATNGALRAEKSTSTIIAAWCVVTLTSPGVILWKLCRPTDKGDK